MATESLLHAPHFGGSAMDDILLHRFEIPSSCAQSALVTQSALGPSDSNLLDEAWGADSPQDETADLLQRSMSGLSLNQKASEPLAFRGFGETPAAAMDFRNHDSRQLELRQLRPIGTGIDQPLADAVVTQNTKAFTLEVGLVCPVTGSLANTVSLPLSASLFYENGYPVQQKPGEPTPLDGDVVACLLEGRTVLKLRINPLSYHHQRQRFRIRVCPMDAELARAYPNLSFFTAPLRNVAKPLERQSSSSSGGSTTCTTTTSSSCGSGSSGSSHPQPGSPMSFSSQSQHTNPSSPPGLPQATLPAPVFAQCLLPGYQPGLTQMVAAPQGSCPSSQIPMTSCPMVTTPGALLPPTADATALAELQLLQKQLEAEAAERQWYQSLMEKQQIELHMLAAQRQTIEYEVQQLKQSCSGLQ